MKTKKVFMCFYKLILLAVMYRLSTCVNVLRKRIWCTKKITQRDPLSGGPGGELFKKSIVCVTHEHVFDRACDSTKLS